MRTAARLLAAALLLLAGSSACAHPSRAIVVAPDGRIYFTDLERLWLIGRDGRLRKLREQRDRHTHELAIDGAGNLMGEDSSYVGGGYREALWRLTPDGQFRYLYGPTMRAERGFGVIRDVRGCYYHSNEGMEGHRPLVHRRCPDGRVQLLFGSASDDRSFEQVLLSNVAGSTLDRAGNFYFRQGEAVRRIQADGTVRIVATGIARENFGMALDRDGTILIAESAARRVLRLAPGGRRSLAMTSAKPWSPTGVAVSRGRIYVLEATDYQRGVDSRMRVRRFAANGSSDILATVTIPPP